MFPCATEKPQHFKLFNEIFSDFILYRSKKLGMIYFRFGVAFTWPFFSIQGVVPENILKLGLRMLHLPSREGKIKQT